MHALAAAFFGENTGLRLALLTSRHNVAALDLAPFGVTATACAAEDHPALLARYHAANARAFPPELALPGWVLGDLYVLPSAIGLLLDPDDAIAAAYVAVPSLEASTFVGVSLLSQLPGRGAGAWIKALTLRAIRARRLRGVVQWTSPSLRTHTRLGPLRIVGPAPASHERAHESFVYEIDVADEGALAAAMRRDPAASGGAEGDARGATAGVLQRLRSDDHAGRAAVLEAVAAGRAVHVVPPGIDDTGHLLLSRGDVP